MTKKTDGKNRIVYGPGIDADKVNTHAKNICTLRQDLDDARMAHATAWKEAKEDGIHKGALRHVLKLKGQGAAKTRDFQTHVEAYAEIVGLNRQLELFDQESETAAHEESIGKASESVPPAP